MSKALDVALINMPFAELEWASLALTQLKAIADKRFGTSVHTEILYLNHDFVRFFGRERYRNFSMETGRQKTGLDIVSSTTGLREWFFRRLAFPEEADNADEYFTAFYSEKPELKDYLLIKREELSAFLDALIEKYGLADRDILGFTSMFEQQVASLALARKIKERNPRIITMLGGSNCEYPAGPVLSRNLEMMDYVLSGPGLLSFPEIISCHMENRRAEVAKIAGVFARYDVKESLERSAAPTAPDSTALEEVGNELSIDEVLELDYDSFFTSLNDHFPNYTTHPILFFETSRGCRWAEKSQCTFCDINGRNLKYRTMSPQVAFQLLRSLLKYRDKCCCFWAIDSVIPIEYLTEVFPRLSEELGDARFFYEVRADIKREEIQKLAEYHICFVQAGIESLISKSLRLLKKGTDVFDNLIFLKNCCFSAVNVLWNILVGIPEETATDYERCCRIIPSLFHLPPPSGVWSISYQRNSVYVKNQEKYGLKLAANIQADRYIYPFSEGDLRDMAYTYENLKKYTFFSFPVMKRIQKMSALVEKWKNAWRNPAKRVLPRLYLSDENKIYDSRDEAVKEYRIGSAEVLLLKAMEVPCTIEDLKARIPKLEEKEIRSCVEGFLEKHLIFEEGKRYLSLIHLGRPKLKTAFIPETFDELLKANHNGKGVEYQ